MTIEEYFQGLASKQEITATEQDHISKKHNSLREKLRETLEVEDDFLTGSYSRKTMIRPKDSEKFDVDFFLVFSKENYGEKDLPELLKLVRGALGEIRQEDNDILEIVDQKRSIGVVYKENFQIDVVPAIEIKKGERYKIYDKRTLAAVESNPKLHAQNLTDANDATESGGKKRLVPIIKILKAWKRLKCKDLKSFHLETLAVHILKDGEILSFSQGLAKFFQNAGAYLEKACLPDPANGENILDAYLDTDRTRSGVLRVVADTASVAHTANELEGEGENDKALAEWRNIFEDANSKKYTFSTGPVIINRTPAKPWLS